MRERKKKLVPGWVNGWICLILGLLAGWGVFTWWVLYARR
jgi:hypothetical protein